MTAEMQKEAAEARVGADRMAMGLPCIPDPLRGDMVEIERLRRELTLALAEIERQRTDYSILKTDYDALRADNERLRAALEPFARNVDAVSLSATLGHITREDLWRARAALEPKP